jgi:hypothetical protein
MNLCLARDKRVVVAGDDCVADPDDVVVPILFLTGDGTRHITGQVIHVNGGRITP